MKNSTIAVLLHISITEALLPLNSGGGTAGDVGNTVGNICESGTFILKCKSNIWYAGCGAEYLEGEGG